jgi:signal transduction histidine kinase
MPGRPVALIVALGLLPAILFRRTRPLPMLALVFVVTGLAPVVTSAGTDQYAMAYVLLFPYAVFRWGSGREAAAGATIIVVKVVLWMLLGLMHLGDVFAGFGVLFSLMALGAAFRYRARARQRELDQVKLIERERLARDLHDTVAHHVSAMAIRAQAGIATSTVRPAAAVEALHVIEAEASKALTEMRAMVRVLRDDEPAARTPGPRIADVATLADGSFVDVRIDGDVDDLPPSVCAAVFRLAQESVTNARRHAKHATRIEVRVAADAESVRLRVTDDGEAAPVNQHGYGLRGMAERAGLLGGTCEAGPRDGRGWTVTAVLPRAGAAA